MASVGAQPQFRYTQPPSKVLHLRNLPWECAEEELIELCKPFGKVVNTKCNVGANRNQAFVEFADLNQAISMVAYHASSSEPAQIRGKTVYLQYSNRQEIVNNKNTGEIASNVLLVTIEGVEAGDVSIDILHLVFSAFGFVHKIATFEKAAGFQALVQFSDPNTASAARSALDGRSIPRYLLPDRVGPCHLRISFSAHSDLNVKFQSHRSRDYTNPDLPVAPSAIDGTGQFDVGPDGKRKEAESNVLLASIENMQYAVTIDVLHAVFSAFGTVQKIAMFEKNAGFQALVQYADVQTAIVAREALEGHCIYDGDFCKLHLSYSRHTNLNVKVNNDRSRDYTSPNPGLLQNQLSILGQQPSTVQSTLPIPIGVSPAAPSGYTGNQLIGGIPPRHVDTVTRPPLPQGWGFDITNTVVPGAGFASMPATSPMNGPGGSSMAGGPHASAGGRPFHAGMFPPQQNSFLRAPYPPAGLSGASTSVPIAGPPVGHMFTGSNMNAVPPPPQSMAPFSRDQLIPTPGPMAMPAVSRPTAYYM